MKRHINKILNVVIVLSLFLALAITTPVRAVVIDPRQEWFRNAKAGLFLHWGMRTSPAYLGKDASAWEARVTADGWNANYWVDEAIKLHASYLVLASFHSRLGYVRTWPSQIPGSPRTQRDFLGELIAAAKARGLKVILYMTDDPQWHDETGVESLDSAAYSAYKGRSIDLTTRDGFGEFSYDNFFEVMQNYPDLAGFWIDNDNAYWETHNLYGQIRQIRPTWLLSNNNENTPIMDTVSHEQKTGMTPDYDYAAATWVPLPQKQEADFKLAGGWWYNGTNPVVDRRLSIGRYMSTAGSSINALIAEGAQHGGRFPSELESFNNFIDGYLDQIWESIGGTEGGGYMYGGLQPGSAPNGAFLYTTISKADPNIHYIHVITRPSGSTLSLRDSGYKVTAVTNLRTGASMNFSQGNGSLSITGISSWDSYDTVFKVVTAGKLFVYPQSSMIATASASASGHPASSLVDGNYSTYWDSNTTVPVSITFDLGSPKKVASIGINQTEWSVSYARSATEDSARIKGYSIFVSNDGTNWGSAIKTGTLESARGIRFIDVNVPSTRFIRLTVNSTWAASTATNFYRKLRIDEMYVFSDFVSSSTPTPTWTPTPTQPPGGNVYQAEAASLGGGVLVESNHTGFNGTGFVNFPLSGGFVQFNNADGGTGGSATLRIRYALGATTARTGLLIVNGASQNITFNPTANWDTWVTQDVVVPLNAGTTNTIRFESNGQDLGNLDQIQVIPSGGPTNTPTATATSTSTPTATATPTQPPGSDMYQAEAASFGGGVTIDSNNAGFLGTGYANFPLSGGFLQFNNVNGGTGGSATLRIRYALGATTSRTGLLMVNGASQNLTFNPTGAWTTWATQDVVVSLNAGTTNTLRFESNGQDLGNIDQIEVLLTGPGSIEAEAGTLAGAAVVRSCSACSGGQKVGFIGNGAANYVTLTVNAPSSGSYQLTIYGTVNGTRSFSVSVNGGADQTVSFTGTSFDTPIPQTITISLNAGSNTIRFHNDAAYAPDLDRIVIQ